MMLSMYVCMPREQKPNKTMPRTTNWCTQNQSKKPYLRYSVLGKYAHSCASG